MKKMIPILPLALACFGCGTTGDQIGVQQGSPTEVASIELEPQSAAIECCGYTDFKATVKNAQDVTLLRTELIWSSSNEAAATVQAMAGFAEFDARAFAKSAGTTTIKACAGQVCGTAQLTVTAAPGGGATGGTTPTLPTLASLSVSPSSATVQVGKTIQLLATAKDSTGKSISGASPTWTSSASTIATVDPNGLVTGVAAGSATIKACSGSICGNANVTVSKAAPTLASITVTPSTATIFAGSTQQFSAEAKDQTGNTIDIGTFTWFSGDATIATVSTTGLAFGNAKGTVTIEACNAMRTVCGKATLTVQTKEDILSSIALAFTGSAEAWDEATKTVSVPKADTTLFRSAYILAATPKDKGGNVINVPSPDVLTCHWNVSDPSWVSLKLSGPETLTSDCTATISVSKDYFDNGNQVPTTSVSVNIGSVFSNTVTIEGIINLESSTWNFTLNGTPHECNPFTVEQTGKREIRAWCPSYGYNYSTPVYKGSLSGNTITWSPDYCPLTGTVGSPTTMSGTGPGGNCESTWSATKQ